jgi:hypothetical protein
MTEDKTPFLAIADTSSATLGQSSGLFVSFANNFKAGAQLNDIKVARTSGGKVYAFVANNTSTNQFSVIDVTDIRNPVLIVSRSLSGVSSSGSFPQGFRIAYFDGKAYVTARETTGPELHVFNVATPGTASSVTEIGTGTELNRTVEDLVITKQTISGTLHYFAYAATDKDGTELSIYDVTNPSAVHELNGTGGFPNAEPTFAGTQDGASVFLTNNKLYLGSISATGSELYVYDATNPLSGSALPLLTQKDIGTSATGIVVSGQFLFISTSKANQEFQVYNASTLASVSNFNFPNVITRGVAYENDWVYVASQGNDALRIIYSPN